MIPDSIPLLPEISYQLFVQLAFHVKYTLILDLIPGINSLDLHNIDRAGCEEDIVGDKSRREGSIRRPSLISNQDQTNKSRLILEEIPPPLPLMHD